MKELVFVLCRLLGAEIEGKRRKTGSNARISSYIFLAKPQTLREQPLVIWKKTMQWYFVAALLTVLTSSQGILTTLSQSNGKYKYDYATVPYLAEVFKLIVSSLLLWRECRISPSVRITTDWRSVRLYPIPSVIYLIHNNVQFATLVYVDTSTYQILGNLKIVTTGILFRLFLRKKLSNLQWIAIVLLAVGTTTSQVKGCGEASCDSLLSAPIQGYMLGILSACMSALAGVYTEFLMKKNNDSLYWQNVQLYTFGVIFNIARLGFDDFRGEFENGPWWQRLFNGYSLTTWLVVLNLGSTGLLVSWLMKYADNIVKVYSTSMAMLLTMVLSVYLFTFKPTLQSDRGWSLCQVECNLYRLTSLLIGTMDREDQTPVQQSAFVDNSDGYSIFALMRVINGYLNGERIETMGFMATLMRPQMATTDQWVDVRVKVRIWCIFVGFDKFGGGFEIKERERIYYAFTNQKNNWKRKQKTNFRENMANEVEELAIQLEGGMELSNIELGVKLIVKSKLYLRAGALGCNEAKPICEKMDEGFCDGRSSHAFGSFLGVNEEDSTTRTRMIRDVLEALRMINVIWGRKGQAGVSRKGENLAQIKKGNNTLGEDDRVTVGSGRIGSSSELREITALCRLRENHQSIVVARTSASVPIHASSGGSGDLNTDGLQLTGRGNKGEGKQIGEGRKRLVKGQFVGGPSCLTLRTLWMRRQQRGDRDMEIKDAVFNMGGSKAPGLDGFQGIFFQSYWDIIAVEVYGIVAECLVGDGCPFVINSTNIALIPMVFNLENLALELCVTLNMPKVDDPVTLCNEIDTVVSRFWWAGIDKDRGIHWINWKDLGCSKREGGMGFHNFKDFNIALLAKQCWRLIHDPDSLWARVLKERECKVAEFIDPVSREWNIDLLSNLVSEEEWVAISHIHVRPATGLDKLVWPFKRNGSFVVKSGYRCLACGVHRPSQWSPPPVNWRKVNVNVCWRRNSLCGNVGVVVRDSFFGCNAMWSVRVHASTIEMAEALAVLEGCLLAKNLQLQEDAEGVDFPYNNALVISVQLAHAIVDMMMVDNGVIVNLLQLSVIQKMDLEGTRRRAEVFDLILQEAVNKILKPEQMIKKVLVVTHDDFNMKDWLATYEEIGRKFEKNGYDDVAYVTQWCLHDYQGVLIVNDYTDSFFRLFSEYDLLFFNGYVNFTGKKIVSGSAFD
ncbi:CMP-sialic acid transporter 1-like [Pyrus ussuriensis x Pyrus communis]|uniref:CMP-sialic acid transporter 1-like n=1 Tax=Pyrus ussuriensis x Pyrus communis TaxID=2448454 RepID=A0A5N5G543_9ROSA|nr:CMP-sialic acid transporter 1-like [Pyrus ussuriensis x Pyrus communis]